MGLRVKLLSKHAIAPVRGSLKAAGYDLFSSGKFSIGPRSSALVSTEVAIALPPGTYGRVAPRSGLATKHGIDVGAGVIDEDYRGEVKVLLFNHSDKVYEVEPGTRIAQLIIEKIETPNVEVVEELDNTERGSEGFGSTGIN